MVGPLIAPYGVDVWRGVAHVSVGSEMIGSQRIDRDEQDVLDRRVPALTGRRQRCGQEHSEEEL